MDIKKIYNVFVLIFLFSLNLHAQVDSLKIAQDTLNNNNSEKTFEINFFQALSERGIENYKKAIQILTEIEKESKDEPVVYFQLGLNYFDLEQYDLALENLNKAETYKPEDLNIKEVIFKVYEQQKKYNQAVEYARIIAIEKPDFHEVLANLHFINQNYQEAIEALEKADKHQGFDAHKDKLRVVIYRASEQFAKAVDYFKERRSYEPYNPLHSLRLVEFLMLQEDYEKAIQENNRALNSHPRFTRFYVQQTEIYLALNKPKESLNALREVVTDRFLEEKYKVEAIDLFKSYVETHTELQEDFIQILNLASQKAEDSASFLDLGLYYFDTDKPKALINFKKALEQNPQDFEILKRISILQYQLEDYENALQTAEEALSIYPSQVVFMLVKGQVLCKQTQYNEAKSVLEEAQSYIFEENETMLMLYKSLSQVYEGLGENEKAIDYKTKAETLKSKLN